MLGIPKNHGLLASYVGYSTILLGGTGSMGEKEYQKTIRDRSYEN